MAMMISKFHRLIQSRLLWGAFLIIIVFSFVIWGMVWPSDIKKAEHANAAGQLNGEYVTANEYRSAYLSTYLARALALGREIQSTPETDAILRRMSWERLATLREVAKLGIVATDPELVAAIRSNFAETNGTFNPQRYQAFLQNIIRPLGFTAAQFEQHLREEIQIQKLAHLIGRQAQVAPLEIRRTFETLLDEFTVEYAAILPADVAQDVQVSEEDARKLYDADPQAFTIPEQRQVSYAAFPIAGYLDENVEIADDDIQDYYELHIQDYTTTETDTNGNPREVVADLEDVRTNIVAALRREAALEKADAAATELAFRAIPDRDGTIPVFAEQVEKSGLQMQTLPPFSRFEVPLEDGGAAFAAAAFELAPNAYDRVSAPVAGASNVYVLYLEKEIEARVPDFAEIKDKVMAAAREKAIADAVSAKATKVRDEAVAGLGAGRSFADSVSGTGLQVSTTEPFTGLSGSSSTNAAVQALVQAVVGYNQGEVTDPLAGEDGLIVAYILKRIPADDATYDSYQTEISAAIRARRGQTLFRDWQAALLAPEHFTDLQRVTPAEDEEPAAEEPDDLSGEDATGAAAADEPM